MSYFVRISHRLLCHNSTIELVLDSVLVLIQRCVAGLQGSEGIEGSVAALAHVFTFEVRTGLLQGALSSSEKRATPFDVVNTVTMLANSHRLTTDAVIGHLNRYLGIINTELTILNIESCRKYEY